MRPIAASAARFAVCVSDTRIAASRAKRLNRSRCRLGLAHVCPRTRVCVLNVGGPDWHHLANTIKRSARGGDAALKGKGYPFSIAERRVPELIPVLGSQPAGDVSYKSGGRLPLLFARPAVTLATLEMVATNFAVWSTETRCMGVNSLPKTVTRHRRGCDLSPGPILRLSPAR